MRDYKKGYWAWLYCNTCKKGLEYRFVWNEQEERGSTRCRVCHGD